MPADHTREQAVALYAQLERNLNNCNLSHDGLRLADLFDITAALQAARNAAIDEVVAARAVRAANYIARLERMETVEEAEAAFLELWELVQALVPMVAALQQRDAAMPAARNAALRTLAVSKSGFPLDHATAANAGGVVFYFANTGERDAFLEMAAGLDRAPLNPPSATTGEKS